MRSIPLLFTLLAFSLASLNAQSGKAQRYGSVPHGGVLDSGALPDLKAFTSDGEAIKLRELCADSYTVLKAGCLTCPQFHRGYGELEAAYADYSNKGVKFFYFYKSLRHPELGGYVQPQNIQERLLQLEKAKEMLGTKVPWISDTIEDSIRIGLRSGSNSVYLISPNGKIVYASSKFDGDALRAALAKAVGPIKKPTQVSDLNLPNIQKVKSPANTDSQLTVARPEGMRILSIAPTTPEDTYYVKLRAEANSALLENGKGRLFLGFYPDPIHDAYWNNLTPPMKYTLSLPKGTIASPSEASAQKGPADNDTQPRQFWVDLTAKEIPSEFTVTLHYYACTPEMCEAMTHEYTVRLEAEERGASTFGFNRGPGGRGNQKGEQRKKNR